MSMSAGVLILLVSAAHAQPADDEIFTHLLGARSVRCDFETGTHGSWDSGRLKLERAAWGKGNTMTVDSIDIKEGTARLIANVGAGDVRVLMTPTRLTFVGGDRPRQPQLHRRVRWLWPFPAAHRGPISAHEDSQRPVPVPVPQHLLHSRIARDAAAICYFLYACGIAAGLVLLVPWASAGKAGTS
jgi:hypothetical protein